MGKSETLYCLTHQYNRQLISQINTSVSVLDEPLRTESVTLKKTLVCGEAVINEQSQ